MTYLRTYRSQVMKIDEKKIINYIVTTQGWSGKKVTECETEDEAWKALGKCSIGSLVYVTSPTGKSVSQFTPF
jgi:hypothetical protein